ncbi:MAG: hypothetical protein ACI959_001680 [Limisphaerales bacterium]|jgi:uncharacterized protein (DUF58 family)
MRKLFGSLFLTDRFFQCIGILIAVFALAFALPFLFIIGQLLIAMLLGVIVFDILILFEKTVKIEIERDAGKMLSLGDENTVEVKLRNRSSRTFNAQLLDEVPSQFQIRKFKVDFEFEANKRKVLSYKLRPVTRGVYVFGKIHLYIQSRLGFIERRFTEEASKDIACYPSVLQMKSFELLALARISHFEGIKKIRRLGHSYEFEQIKGYVQGDDVRSINWKATSRKHNLMVNQYEDERSQQVYSLIDVGRAMKMPFDGMSLLDYAINTSLVISNVAIKKHDKAGLITFDKQLKTAVLAERKRGQMKTLLEALYRQSESDLETNFELVYRAVSKMIPARSLVILFTNFESEYAVERALPVLRKLARRHLLLMVFFENTEISKAVYKKANDILGIYEKTIAGDFISQKKQMAVRANQFGIQTVLTKPEDLSMSTVNKYLELKARGMI